ncbi:MAG TPA: Ger(x)C family spore germination C-terminal domain-containing protein, partial [Sporolactobacillaceae bacterium]|nr:Ger(x)C family spore germination C-terminal domain-containing protein [Sporolactobacillaceae bacterium]
SMGEASVNKKAFNNIQSRASEEIKQEILSTFNIFQKLGVDPYGYGRMVLVGNPSLFRQDNLKSNWKDEFKDSVFHVNVQLKLRGKGELM